MLPVVLDKVRKEKMISGVGVPAQASQRDLKVVISSLSEILVFCNRDVETAENQIQSLTLQIDEFPIFQGV